ncbi:hypothetical protein NHQ30_008702 [Ciborinia camelliae]|nr:hypothetical protein NHQ30_008702 [Ciborinia camelliae]
MTFPKCDETKPACLKCTSTRRVCPGYHHVQPLDLSPSGDTILITTEPSFNILSSPQSKRSFAFFMRRTCSQLAGFFGSNFWERLVLQTAHHESAIRHAVVALGSIHELSERKTPVLELDKAFALEQYNLAIRDLLVPLSRNEKRGVDVCLIACILFAHFESMQGRRASAGAHIRSGAKLLLETVYDQQNGVIHHQILGSRSSIDSYSSPGALARIYAGLDRECTTVQGFLSERYEHLFSNDPTSETTNNDNPVLFRNVEEAKNVFEYGCYLFQRATQPPGDPVNLNIDLETRIYQSIDYFEALNSKYSHELQAFIESKSLSLSRKEHIAAAVLQLHVLDNHISFYVEYLPSTHRSHWKKFMPQIQRMVMLGQNIVSYILSDSSCGESTVSYNMDMGFIIPFYNVARHCKDPIIRRQIISLLRSVKRQEGLWNSLLIAKALERIVEIEESAWSGVDACADHEYEVRPLSVDPILELDSRGGRLKYTRQGQEINAQIKVVEEIFSCPRELATLRPRRGKLYQGRKAAEFLDRALQCTCTAKGALNVPPPTTGGSGKAAPGLDPLVYNDICEFACSRGYCPEGVCSPAGTDSGTGDFRVYVPPSIWTDPQPIVQLGYYPSCTLILPPFTLPAATVISFDPYVTPLEVFNVTVTTIITYTDTAAGTFYVSEVMQGTASTTNTTIFVPPLTTDVLNFWNIPIDDPDDKESLIPITISILPPIVTITETSAGTTYGRTIHPPPWPYTNPTPRSKSSDGPPPWCTMLRPEQ